MNADATKKQVNTARDLLEAFDSALNLHEHLPPALSAAFGLGLLVGGAGYKDRPFIDGEISCARYMARCGTKKRKYAPKKLSAIEKKMQAVMQEIFDRLPPQKEQT
jgi:hypothetical protein